MKRTVGYVAFRRALSIIFLPKAILAFVYMCLLIPVDTPGVASRSDAINSVAARVQPIFRDICFFLFTRNNYTSGNRNSFAVSLLIKVRIETTIFFYS